MGIGQSIATSMAENQKKMMEEQMKKQYEMQKKAQERMRRQMISQQMAMARERVYWMGAAYSGLVLGLIMNTIKTKKFPTMAIPPLYISSFVLSYQIDFAFYNKAERINEIQKKILTEEQHWFVPIDIPENK
jgi:hypothetical protein